MHLAAQPPADLRPQARAGAGDVSRLPATTGLDAMDYRLTDPYLDPPGPGDANYSEISIRLPQTFWCYEPVREPSPIEPPAVAHGYITFGCLNNFCKVTTPTVTAWRQLMQAVPRAPVSSCTPRKGIISSICEISSPRPASNQTASRSSASGRSTSTSNPIMKSISRWNPSPAPAERQLAMHSGWAFPWSRWQAKPPSAGPASPSCQTSAFPIWSPLAPANMFKSPPISPLIRIGLKS